MLGQFQYGGILKSQICDEVYNGLAQQSRDRVEIKRYDQHWFGESNIKILGYQNTETIVVDKRPKYIK